MQNKIFWFGFKRNLTELYYLLFSQKFISCDIDEFIAHFTGKKFRIDEKYNELLTWNNETYLLTALINHLTEKGFLNEETESIMKHFKCPHEGEFENHPEVNKFQQQLNCLFPEPSGLRCKQRLYYKERNKQSILAVFKRCGIIPFVIPA